MKKTISLLLTLVLLLSTFSGCVSVFEKQPENTGENTTTAPYLNKETNPASDFEYKTNEDGGITITRYIGQNKNVIIPETIQNMPVTQIGLHAFVTMAIGEILMLSPSFPPPHTVHDSFQSHGVPSKNNLNFYSLQFQETIIRHRLIPQTYAIC